jgi:serine protease Do
MARTSSYWEQLSAEISAAVAKAAASVVAVHGRHRVGSTGFAWDERTVITAAHTLTHDQEIRITLPDGTQANASLVGRDGGTDLAALAVESPLPAVPRAARTALAPGHWTVAVARRAEGGTAVSGGIVSETGPAWRTWRGGLIDQTVRLDGTVAPWFCGAPLLDASGAAAGLCTTGLRRGRAVVIPLETLDRITAELKAKGHVSRAYIGLAMQRAELPTPVAQKLSMTSPYGALIVSVQPGAPGEQAGIMIGDVLVQLGPKAVADAADVQDVLTGTTPGQSLPAVLVRGGERLAIDLATGERAAHRRAR